MTLAPEVQAKVSHHYLRLKAMMAMRDRDPLAWFRFSVLRLREAFALLAAEKNPISELHVISANKLGKTYQVAAYVIACCQKRKTLDGVPLPQWRGPVEAAQLVLDYPQQLLSVQPAYLRALGKWPYRISARSGEIIKTIRVMPQGGSMDERDWSVIHFLSQENRRSGTGVRGDIVAFDEPPRIEILRELRKAAHAGRRLIILAGWTPTIRSQWAPVMADLGEHIGSSTGRSRIHVIDRRRAAVRCSLDEVLPHVLTKAERDDLLYTYLGEAMDIDKPVDPLAKARIHGDAIDTSGLCPFHVDTLREMYNECRDPIDTVEWELTQQDSEKKHKFPVEVWKHARVDTLYWMPIDPSSGIPDKQHDPFQLDVVEDVTGDLCVAAGGYLVGYLVGVLGAGIARQYNGCPIDPEVNDRWGVNVVEGVHASRYSNFARERRELRPGEFSDEIGFHNTQKTRPQIIGAVQAWVEAWRVGTRYAVCPSRKHIQTLLDCIVDANGKIVAAPGYHDERLITWGQGLRRACRRRGLEIPKVHAPVKTHDQRLLEELAKPERRPVGRQGMRVPIARSRV